MLLRVCLVAAALVLVPAAGSGVPASELNALADLYFATGGNTSWIRTAGWSTLDEGGTPSDPCDDAWFGVTCSEERKFRVGTKHVVGLDLSLGRLGARAPLLRAVSRRRGGL